ncbi:tRNA guanosine(34) transglycosylase Tgt [Sandaracinobacteroides saxicola]|uniref:Queuine tRNA-ribosyltransferase n=1 Tax=Sandaracinobacteroides saxicola TaxID=2759707 RepID=A0A7G5IL61_9SPHN|nr:tRNA guanosine(34) transglycosylase Tgt [Sandaracinobacteroides saxicola]QMW24103.1 queuine tRNA-ribosyltransferase [Sandaracinobacteroides saxicola]
MQYMIEAIDGRARTGVVRLPRGEIRTPAFMPVGTAGTVKGMMPGAVRDSGADILLGNTYHLMLRPGAERVARMGGLHAFMNWPHPILTDSGGYQVMSLGALRRVSEEGVAFASHLDGSRHMLSPERSMEIQWLLGSDIVMAFDELVALPAEREVVRAAMQRSLRWAARSKAAFLALQDRPAASASRPPPPEGEDRPPPSSLRDATSPASGGGALDGVLRGGRNAALFGIQQGGLDEGMRAESAAGLLDIGFPGYAIGGLAVGEGQAAMFGCLDYAPGQLDPAKPRYLMGVGKPDDIVGAVERGVDMFDCVLPTRSGRNGQAFTWDGPINLRNARFGEDARPLDADCGCPVCGQYSRAYVHHLVRSREMLGAMLMTQHNLHFYQALMAALRAAIREGRLKAFADGFRLRYAAGAG